MLSDFRTHPYRWFRTLLLCDDKGLVAIFVCNSYLGNFPVLLVIVGILNSYAVSCADAIAVTVQRAFLGASRLQNYIQCPACSEILARTRNSIEPIVPHRLSVRKAIGQSVFRARVLIFEFLLRN